MSIRLGTFENPFGSFDETQQNAIIDIIEIASNRENEKIHVSSTDEFELGMWIVSYDGLLFQVSQIHNLITDDIQYEVHFVEAVVPNTNSYVEINNDAKMQLVEVEYESDEEGDEE